MTYAETKEYTEKDMYNIFQHGYIMGLRSQRDIPYSELFGESMRKMTEQKTGLKPATSYEILNCVCDYFGQDITEVVSRNTRKVDVMIVVKYTSFLCHWFTDDTLQSIGDLLGRDHASVMHHVRDVMDMSSVDKSIANTVNKIVAVIGGDGFFLTKTKRIVKLTFPEWIKY